MRAKSRINPPLLVAKLGGSLYAAPDLPRWIAALKNWPDRLTLVCGGGPFADAVRSAQPKMGFTDATGHAMALLAMEQYALALAQLYGLDLASSGAEINALHARGRLALWRPSAMVAAASDIDADWRVTSDSLAAWLAHETQASLLLLIKSVDVAPNLTVEDLVAAEVVDRAFPAYHAATPLFVAGPRAVDHAARQLGEASLPGVAIAPRKKIA
jgi:dihydroneopterin aldolase